MKTVFLQGEKPGERRDSTTGRIKFDSQVAKFALTPSPQTWRMRRHEPSSHAPTAQLEMVTAEPRRCFAARSFLQSTEMRC